MADAPAAPEPARDERRRRILLVEDEEMNRALIRASIDRFGDDLIRSAELIQAATLAEAREAIGRGAVDLVLLDVRLPDGNGLEFAREFRELPEAERPRVLILSASVLPDERTAAIESGADRFVGKPYRPDEVVTAIRELLERPSDYAPSPD
jgi:DNA-binding response OmpR family regulator